MVGLVLNGGAEHQRCLPGGGGIRRGRSGSSVWRPRAAAAANGPAAPGLPGLPMAPQGLLCHHGGPGGSRARAGTAESPPVSATRPLLAARRSPQSCPHRAPATTIGLPQSHLRVPDATQEPLPPKSHYRGATSAKGEQSLTSSHRWHRRAATKAPPLQGHLHGHRDTTATTELPLPP